MAEVTFEKVLADVQQLSRADQQRLHALLAKELRQQERFKPLEQIALEQGKRPLKFEELLGPEPEPGADDEVDEFLRDLREWRSAQTAREFD